jgi:tetratricopeptide (TPR) repeat protein
VTKFPFAAKEAEAHFNRAIELVNQIGAKGRAGEAYLDLGHLHRSKGRSDQAKACISKAIQLFEECEAEVFLRQAHESLASL